MDRYLAAFVTLSLAAHGLILMHLPSFGTASSVPGVQEMEVSYLETPLSEDEPPERGLTLEKAAGKIEVGKPKKAPVPGNASELLKGTGQELRASVRELLRPLDVPRPAARAGDTRVVMRYKKLLEEILERDSGLSYPREAKMRGEEARYIVRFSVRADGSLARVDLPPGSGEFGDEIVAGLRKAAAHFPAFPPGIGSSELIFCWPVSFALD